MSLTQERVAEYLIEEGFDLTALEFFQELSEAWSGQDERPSLPAVLEKRFNKAPDFQTNDLEFFNAASKTGERTEKDDRIAMLEYELRLAREDIAELRSRKVVRKEAPAGESKKIDTTGSRANDVERRTLNFLFRKYLMDQEYNLTAITMSEEVQDQDLDSWEDIGGDEPAPPSVLALYRHYYAGNAEFRQLQEAAALTSKKIQQLEASLAVKDREIGRLAGLVAAAPVDSPAPATGSTSSFYHSS